MAAWSQPLALWLHRFAGLEKWIRPPSAFPVAQVEATLLRYLEERVLISDERFAGDLAALDFLGWQAQSGDGRRWSPLEQAFSAFEASCGGLPIVWDSDRPVAPPAVIEAWLLEQLYGEISD